MIRCLAAVVAITFALAACSARPQPAQAQSTQLPSETRELSGRQELDERVDALVGQGNFKALDTLAKQYRSGDDHTGAGVPRLQLVYEDVSSQVDAAEHETRCASPLADQITAWAKANPASPTAVNLNAIVLMDRAWCYRGGQYGASVPQRDWAPFEHYIQEARTELETHQDVGQTDPQWFANMEGVALAQGWSADDFLKLVRTGWNRFPTYLAIYQSGMIYFSPRWYGDNGQMDAFARMAAERTTATEGKAMYARLYWAVFDQLSLDNLKTETAIDWSLMRLGMDDFTRVYPDAWNSFSMARLACYAGDHELMMHYLRQVYPALDSFGDPNTPDSVLCNRITIPRAQSASNADDCNHCKGR